VRYDITTIAVSLFFAQVQSAQQALQRFTREQWPENFQGHFNTDY